MRPRRSRTRPTSDSERGSAFLEFALCTALILVPLLMGTTVLGMNISRAIQVSEVCRDAAHLYASGVDFSTTTGQQLLTQLAAGMDISSSGKGVIIFSTVTYIASSDCTGAGFTTSNCTNMNNTVFTKRVVVGNTSVATSYFGTPKSSLMDSSGNVAMGTPNGTAGYMNDSSAVASNFTTITLSSGQYSYLGEMKLNTPELSWWAPLGTTGISAKSYF